MSAGDAPQPRGARTIRIQLLGGFQVWVGARRIEDAAWNRRKIATLVKRLALAPRHQLHREQVLEDLWPDLDPERAVNNLHRTVHHIRRAFDPGGREGIDSYVRLQGDQLGLGAPDGLWIDADAFRSAAAAARASGKVEEFEAALALYTGDLLPEDIYEPWAETPREELRRLYLDLLEHLARRQVARGQASRAIETLRQVVAADPTHEPAQVALMRLYAETGRPAAARRQFGQLTDALARELDATPSPASRRVYQAIVEGSYPAARAERPAAPNPDAAPNPAAPPADAASARPRPAPSLPSGTATFLLTRSRPYVIDGGSDQLPAAFAVRLGNRIRYGAAVTGIERADDGVVLTYTSDGESMSLDADWVICAVPFSILQHRSISLSPPFSWPKMRAIQELRYTSVTRVFLQVRSRFWEDQDMSAEATTDLWIGEIAHETDGQPGPQGILGSYQVGGSARWAASLPEGQRQLATLRELERVFPGAAHYYEDVGTTYVWDHDEWARGAYSALRPGQMASLHPHIALPEGRVHFAGEHTSAWPAWMEGALASGVRAAQEVMEAIAHGLTSGDARSGRSTIARRGFDSRPHSG